MLLGGNEYYSLGLRPETSKIFAGFGGGFNAEELCGALSGGAGVLGLVFTRENGYEAGVVNEATKEFVETFKAALSATNCKTIKESFRKDDIKCTPVVIKSAEILEKIIKKYQR